MDQLTDRVSDMIAQQMLNWGQSNSYIRNYFILAFKFTFFCHLASDKQSPTNSTSYQQKKTKTFLALYWYVMQFGCTARSIEIVPHSKWGRGPSLEFVKLQPPKVGPPLEFISVQTPKRVPISRIHQPKGVCLQISSTKRGSASRFYQPKRNPINQKRGSTSRDNFYESSGSHNKLFLTYPLLQLTQRIDQVTQLMRCGPFSTLFLSQNALKT